MSKSIYMHYFTAGLFVAAALSPHVTVAALLAVILVLRWGNFTLPVIAALLVDSSLVVNRDLGNLYGFLLTVPTVLGSMILIKLRKFLKF